MEKIEGKQIECGGFTFLCNFDSANLSRVELVPRKPAASSESAAKQTKKQNHCNNPTPFIQRKSKPVEFPDYEFNIWTNPDCSGTEFENTNRTWFHFGVTGGTVFSLVKLNIIDLNKQSKMYSQGMAPVYKTVPGKCQWERIRDKPVFTSENNVFTLSFKFRTTDNIHSVTYFAFTYPFSYTDLQNFLNAIDLKMSKEENRLPKSEIRFNKGLKIVNDLSDAIYYQRETLCHSLEKRVVDLITISSHHNISSEREPRLQKLFPDENTERPFKFHDKKVIFISARVHPGETPSSFVMNGIINLLVQKDDPIAILLRRQFVFKLIPMLNPDGVARGHYRTDTRGCNLNRFYLNPSRELHPSIYGARSLIRYHHFREEVTDDFTQEKFDVSSQADLQEVSESDFSSPELDSPKTEFIHPKTINVHSQISDLILAQKTVLSFDSNQHDGSLLAQESKSSSDSSMKMLSEKTSTEIVSEKDSLTRDTSEEELHLLLGRDESKTQSVQNEEKINLQKKKTNTKVNRDSGLFLYLDMHGHASKKGVFMYGNHFEKTEDSVECMLFPKIMSVNSQNFHFPACNFTEKNMYLRDKRDGTSREGSGRVAVLRLTGLVRSYTLECNYNTGRFVNKLPQCCRDLPGKTNTNLIVPPKYSPAVYEEIGRSLCISILDLTNSNPWSRIPNSEYHTVLGIRDWLRLKTISESFLYHRPVPRTLLRPKQPNKSSQTQVMMGVLRSDIRSEKLLSNILVAPLHSKQAVNVENHPEDMGRKENITSFRGATCSAISRKEPGSSHTKRSISRISSVLQMRGGVTRSKKKISKFRQTSKKSERSTELTGSSTSRLLSENDRRPKGMTTMSDQCIFKQSPKRLKISKTDDGNKIKVTDWPKEEILQEPSCSDVVMCTKLNRSVTTCESQVKNERPPKRNSNYLR